MAFDGSDDESHAVTFPALRVTMNVVPEFVVDPEVMRLDGFSVKGVTWPRTGGYAPGNSQIRVGSGGLPPYTYRSSKPSVATVRDVGRVVGEGNGTATITITDSRGVAESFDVVVSNIYTAVVNNTPGIKVAQAIAWKDSLPGGRGISYEEADLIRPEYLGMHTNTGGYYEWTCARGNCGAGAGLMEGPYVSVRCVTEGVGNGTLPLAVCLIPKNG